MDPIIFRRLELDLPSEIDPLIVPEAPEEAFAYVAMSLLLPYLEPYLIRSMKEARRHIRDAGLAADLGAFNAQEGQHYRQHRRFNDAIRSRLPDVAAMEAEIEADYERFSGSRTLRFNLAYAEGFEALTLNIARFVLEEGRLDAMTDPARDLFTWHLTEEMEHRTVAFDVYQHVCPGYWYRLAVGLFAQWHLLRFIYLGAKALLAADPRTNLGPADHCGGAAGRRRRLRGLLWQLLPRFLPRVLFSWTPLYTPHRVPQPAWVRALGEHYAALAAVKK